MSNWYKVSYILWGQEFQTILLAENEEMVSDRLEYATILKCEILDK